LTRASLALTRDAREALVNITGALRSEGIEPSDRRLKKAKKVARASAYIQGASEVQPEHMEVLAHVLWNDPREQPQKAAEVVLKIANPTGAVVNGLLAEASQVIDSCDPKDVSSGAVAIKKLKDIHGRLKSVSGGNGRAKKVLEYVEREGKRIKIAYMEGNLS
jgi:MoxR-like ATPase